LKAFFLAKPLTVSLLGSLFLSSTFSPALLLFCSRYVVYKNQIINVYERRYESCGGLWPFVAMRIIAALLVAQITLLGVLSLKLATSVAPFALPLPVLTLVYSYWLRDRFEANFQKYPLEVHANQGATGAQGAASLAPALRNLFLFILVVRKLD
jgi:hypothetical protein